MGKHFSDAGFPSEALGDTMKMIACAVHAISAVNCTEAEFVPLSPHPSCVCQNADCGFGWSRSSRRHVPLFRRHHRIHFRAVKPSARSIRSPLTRSKAAVVFDLHPWSELICLALGQI